MSKIYLVYTWNNLSQQAITVSKMRKIADAWGIDHKGMTRTQLRKAIFEHPKNESQVPHPLIQMPV